MLLKRFDKVPTAELKGRIVLVRIEPPPATSLFDPLATVTYLSQCGARTVIAADQYLDAAQLSHLLAHEVRKLRDWTDNAGRQTARHLPDGGIAFIDDLGRDSGEQLTDDQLATTLAELCAPVQERATLIARCNFSAHRQTEPIVETAAMDKLAINQLPAAELAGKRVFVRIDANGELHACLPTLEYLSAAGARVVIGTHLGQPSGKPRESLRLDPIADALSSLLHKRVRKLDEVIGEHVLRAVTDMKDGDLVMLENLRFHPGEEANDSHFALHVAELCDLYCNEAFALAHHAAASTVAITRHVKPATAGLLLSRELTMFNAVLAKPSPPFLGIVAGGRIEEKLPALQHLLPQLDFLFIGGALAFTFLKAKGYEVGAAPVHQAFLPFVKDLLGNAKVTVTDVFFPFDFIVVNADEFHACAKSDRSMTSLETRTVFDNEIQPWELPVDIGPVTVDRLRNLINDSQTILWNGPLGIAEINRFAGGTIQVARALLENKMRASRRTIVCGEHLSRALRESDLPIEAVRHLSTGGQSALQLLAGRPLPAVAALSDAFDAGSRHKERRRTLLLPVDDSDESREAVNRIGEFVDAEAADIILLYVQKPMRLLRNEELQRRREVERRYQAEAVFTGANAALARQGLISHRQLAAEGKPATEILKCAEDIGVDLIVMGSRGRSGLAGIVKGGVSQTVAKRARCPVLIVRIPEEEVRQAA